MIKFGDIKNVIPNNIEDKIFIDYELLSIVKNNYEIQDDLTELFYFQDL
jgi:hypothetical protein